MSVLLKKENFIFISGLILGLYIFVFNIIGFDFKYFPGDLGDGRLNIYFLEHAYKFMTGQIHSFWNAPFMYPEKNVITYSDNLLGTAPFYTFFRLLGFNIYHSFQLWFVFITILNYTSAYIFLKYIFKDSYAAVLGAFIFAFSIALQSQLTHAQTFPRFAIPLALLFAVKFYENFKPEYFLYSMLFLVYEMYCGIYLGFMLSVSIGIFMIFVVIKYIKTDYKINVKWILKIILYLTISISLLLVLLIPYTERNITPDSNYYKLVSQTIPTLNSYIYSQKGSLIWDFLSTTKQKYIAPWDQQIFPGGVTLFSFIVIFIILIKKIIKLKFNISKLPIVFILILTGFITFILYLKINNKSAYIILYFLPGFTSMRALSRIINIELIFFGIAVSYIYILLFNNIKKHKVFIFLSFLLLISCDNFYFGKNSYKTKVKIAQERIGKMDTTFSKIPKNAVVSYEPEEIKGSVIKYQIDAMILSQKNNLKTLNAYTATSPSSYNLYWFNPNKESRNIWLLDNTINFDTLYVIKNINVIEKISTKTIQEEENIYKLRIQKEIQVIKNDSNWLNLIKEKAKKNKISVDSMLFLDAKWILETKN